MGDIKKLDVAGFLSRVESISPGYIDSLWDRYAEADQFLVEAEQIVATCGIPGIVAPGYVSKIARIETMRKNFALLLEYPYKLVEEVHEIDWKFAKRIDEIWNSYATVKIDDINLKNNLNTDLSDFFVTLKDKGSDRTRLRNKFHLDSVNRPEDGLSLVEQYEKNKDELDAIYYGTEKPEKDLVGESIRSREEAIKNAYDRQEARREQLYRAEDMKSSQKIWEQLQEKTLTEENINDFWLNDPMFEYSYWYQDEKNMAVATAYLRTEIELTGPYVVIKSGKLTEQEEIKKSRIGVLLRLLANAEMKGADDRLLPALENTCARYGKDLYDGIGYSEEDGFIITDEFLDILVKNEEERKCQEFGFLCEKGLMDVIDATMLVAGWYAYSKGLPETTSDGRYTEERMEVERQKITNETADEIKNIDAPRLPAGSQLERNVLNSFASGKADLVKYEGGTKLYRVGGDLGNYWSIKQPPTTEYQWRIENAIKQEFCNNASTLYTITIPNGSSIEGLEGIVGSQGLGLYGGAPQSYIKAYAVPATWIEVQPMTWR